MKTLETIKQEIKEVMDWVESQIEEKERFISSPFCEWKQELKMEELRKYLCCSFHSKEIAYVIIESLKIELVKNGRNPNNISSYICKYVERLVHEANNHFKGNVKMCRICNTLMEKYNQYINK